MSSDLKSQTARTNSRPHGLTASVLLDGESGEHFQLLLADFMDQFQPQTGVETDLVEVLAISRWRLRRLLAIETNLFDQEMAGRKDQIDQEFPGMDHDGRLAFVFKKLSDMGNSLALLIRYQGSINRAYDKALKQLQELQSNRPAPVLPSSNHPFPNTSSSLPHPQINKVGQAVPPAIQSRHHRERSSEWGRFPTCPLTTPYSVFPTPNIFNHRSEHRQLSDIGRNRLPHRPVYWI